MPPKRGPTPPPERGEDAERIARQWERARQRDPRLTPGEWAQRVFPAQLDREGRPVARTKRGAAATLRTILEGRGDDLASAILDRTATRYRVTVGGENARGRTVWVANFIVKTGVPPSELDDEMLLDFILDAYNRQQGSPPFHARQGTAPIVSAHVYRVPMYVGGTIAGNIE
jgi:hypothetical protein